MESISNSTQEVVTAHPNPIYKEFALHHCLPDGSVLVHLSPESLSSRHAEKHSSSEEWSGFGRLTKEMLGGDALADALLQDFAHRQVIPAILTRQRDAHGYRLLTVHLEEAYSALKTYPIAVRCLVCNLVRKHLLKGLGTTTAAVVAKTSEEGLVLELATHRSVAMEILSPQRRSSSAGRKPLAPLPVVGEEVEARVINYNVEAKVFHVTTDPEVVEGTPLHTDAASAALRTLRMGDVVRARVLWSTTDDACAVVTVTIPTVYTNGDVVETASSPSTSAFSSPKEGLSKVPCQLIGYYIYQWGKAVAPQDGMGATGGGTRAGVKPPAIGMEIVARVELLAESSRPLQEVLPFLILSSRVEEDQFSPCPPVRRVLEDYSSLSSALGSLRFASTTTPTSMKMLSKALASSKGTSILQEGLQGQFLWRESSATARAKRVKAGDTASDEDSEADSGRRGGAHQDGAQLRKRKREEAIDAYERSMEKVTPTSPEAFQRLLLASPNSSYLWTQWMAFHLQLQQLEKARLVAEKAISTISPREEAEQLNVWVAYMNLENLYGTGESLNTVFKRALPRQADPMVLHERLADIFDASRKAQQLLGLCRTIVSKWGHRASAWERLGKVLIQQNKRDQLKRMIKDMGNQLKKPDAATVVVRLAVFEFKNGTVEGGRALFDGLIAKVPKKSDVWLAFIDQEIALFARKGPQATLGSVRHLLDRASSINFNPKVMQIIFTKYMNFEKSFGTVKEVEKVKELARQYVQSKIQTGAEPTV